MSRCELEEMARLGLGWPESFRKGLLAWKSAITAPASRWTALQSECASGLALDFFFGGGGERSGEIREESNVTPSSMREKSLAANSLLWDGVSDKLP